MEKQPKNRSNENYNFSRDFFTQFLKSQREKFESFEYINGIYNELQCKIGIFI